MEVSRAQASAFIGALRHGRRDARTHLDAALGEESLPTTRLGEMEPAGTRDADRLLRLADYLEAVARALRSTIQLPPGKPYIERSHGPRITIP